MAARLTVVICQETGVGSAASDLEETLVAELMMAPGLDVTMVGPLDRVDPDDTDFLCLSSFNHSFVILGWMGTDLVKEHWSRLGLSGSIVPYGAETDSQAGEHRIFHIQLQAGITSKSLLGQLNQLLQSRNVKTVSIGGIGVPVKPKTNGSPTSASPKPSDTANPSSAKVAHAGEAGAPGSLARPLNGSAGFTEADEDKEDDQLDQLVDDFDALDL